MNNSAALHGDEIVCTYSIVPKDGFWQFERRFSLCCSNFMQISFQTHCSNITPRGSGTLHNSASKFSGGEKY